MVGAVLFYYVLELQVVVMELEAAVLTPATSKMIDMTNLMEQIPP